MRPPCAVLRRPLLRRQSAGQSAVEVLLITALSVLLVVSLSDDSPIRRLLASLEAHQVRLIKALSLP